MQNCVLTEIERMTKNNITKVPFLGWEGREFCSLCQQDQAYAKFIGIEVFDPVLMENGPSQLDCAVFDMMLPDNKALVELHMANKMCMITWLGQSKSHRTALLNKTKSSDCPYGKAKTGNKSSDANALIEMDNKLDQL